jgi:hypothetical protein
MSNVVLLWWHTHRLVLGFNNFIASSLAKLRKVWESAKKTTEKFASYRKNIYLCIVKQYVWLSG